MWFLDFELSKYVRDCSLEIMTSYSMLWKAWEEE
jgi:hypothetical protein